MWAVCIYGKVLKLFIYACASTIHRILFCIYIWKCAFAERVKIVRGGDGFSFFTRAHKKKNLTTESDSFIAVCVCVNVIEKKKSFAAEKSFEFKKSV